jgi:hypothetical protein
MCKNSQPHLVKQFSMKFDKIKNINKNYKKCELLKYCHIKETTKLKKNINAIDMIFCRNLH